MVCSALQYASRGPVGRRLLLRAGCNRLRSCRLLRPCSLQRAGCNLQRACICSLRRACRILKRVACTCRLERVGVREVDEP